MCELYHNCHAKAIEALLWLRMRKCQVEGDDRMKTLKRIVAVAVLCASVSCFAETETVGGYTWTYRINGGMVENVV